MMGRLQEQAQLLYRFRIEDHIPEDHFLRQVDRFLDLRCRRRRQRYPTRHAAEMAGPCAAQHHHGL